MKEAKKGHLVKWPWELRIVEGVQCAILRIARFKSGSALVTLESMVGVTCRASLAAAVAKRVCCKKDVAARKRAQKMPRRRSRV